jgi:hypothetical protein
MDLNLRNGNACARGRAATGFPLRKIRNERYGKSLYDKINAVARADEKARNSFETKHSGLFQTIAKYVGCSGHGVTIESPSPTATDHAFTKQDGPF